jgi:saccharopine dehydrogenase-like NADP-dependent oxidoreductase
VTQDTMTILVLGGYGGTGKVFCRYLLKETGVKVIVAGRNLAQAEELADSLKKEYSPERISARFADASDKESLRSAFHDIDLVLVAATTVTWAKQVAETALESGIDYLDIYFQQDVYPVLESLSERIRKAGRCFIIQAGFHPGLPAVFIRKGAGYFDHYDKAIIAFAMKVKIEKPESVYELVDLIAGYKADIFKAGKWRVATYKDTIKVDLGRRFGVRSCMPMDMVETRTLPELLQLNETGVYTTGFNWLVDYILFPVMMLTQMVRKGSFRHFWAKTLIWGLNNFSGADEGIVFLLQADGEKYGKHRTVRIVSEHDNAYDFTVIPVIACLKQYFDGTLRKPGLWMMGRIVDPGRLLEDMEKMGVGIQTQITDR